MPGRLMAEHNVLPNKALKSGTGGQIIDAAPPEMTSTGQHSPIKQEALPRGAPNGVLLHNGLAPPNQSSIADLPPEIQHITEGYLSLSKLFSRASQECFNGLNELISELALEPYTPQVNGFPPRDGTGHLQPDNGAQKRLRWLQFANDQRESFIKLLVILQWSKRVDDVSKLVDISVWNGEQRRSYDDSHGYLANMRRDMANARTPAPDVESALEVLNIGGLCRLSDLEYVPPKPLSAQDLLKQLENLNVVLQTRLNLHEDLPYHFQNYSVASGRVTFRVESEFEVDLTVADEDPASQFWFTDFRLLSSSNGSIPATLLDMLAPRVDAALSTGGLAACYELLHEVVLTHRITLLRRQAVAMSRGSWTDALHVEALHRSLVVQYWPQRPGKKNWIQIGIRSTEHDDRVPDESAMTAHVYVKWFCLGKEVVGRGFVLDGHDQFDMESIVKQVLSWHIGMLLGDIRNRFEANVANGSDLSLVQSEDEPAECSLEVPLHGTKAGAVLVEFITGDFALQPVTESSSVYETQLNDKKNAIPDPFVILEQWRASEIRRSIGRDGERAGLHVMNAPEAVRNAFGPGTLTSILFNTSYWSATDWCMAVSVSSHGRTWWVTRTTSKGSSIRILEKERISGALETESEDRSSTSIPNDVERRAAATLCLKLACAHLKGLSVPHLVNADTSSSSKDKMRLNFDAVSLLANGPRKGPLLAKKTCTMTFEGFGGSQLSPATVDCIFSGQLDLREIKPSILPDLQAADLKIDQRGRFSLTVSTPLGSQASIKQFTSRLRFIQQFSILLNTLLRHKIPRELVDTASIRFRYSNHPRYSAIVAFHPKQAPTLELQPNLSNTHVRLLGYMNRLISISPHNQATTFDNVLRILAISQSLLTYIDTLEATDKSGTRVRFLISALSDYRLIYSRVQLTLRIRHIDRRGTSLWMIKPMTPLALVDTDPKVTRTWKHDLNDNLRNLFTQSGDGVVGLTSGVAVEPRAAGKILSRIDAIVLECEAHVPPPPKRTKVKQRTTPAPAPAPSTAETESKTLEKPLAQKGKPGKSEPKPSLESQNQQKQQQQRSDEVVNRSHAGSVASNASGNAVQSQKHQAAAPDVIELD